MIEMELIQYRDAGLPTYTYFWVSEDNRVLSPYFNTKEQAEDWLIAQEKKLTDKQKDC